MDQATHVKTVACIPAMNEEFAVGDVVARAAKFVDLVIVCDDGSHDLTGEVARRAGAEVITNEINLGKGASLHRLFERALEYGPEVVVVLDSDGQHDPSDIPRLLEPIKKGRAEMVVGSRYLQTKSDIPLYRRFGLSVINFFYRGFVADSVKDTQSGYRAFSSKAVGALLSSRSNGFGVEMEHLYIAEKNGFSIVEVPVSVKYEGVVHPSNKNPLLHGYELVNSVYRILMVEKPLRYIGGPGVILAVLGFLIGLDGVYRFYQSGYFSVPIFLIAMGMFLLGTVLFLNAIILHNISRMKSKS